MTMIPPAPDHVLLVLHVAQHSGPQCSLEPRLAALREHGTRVTTLVPAGGPAATQAASLGDVRVGIPAAIFAPRSPRGAISVAGALRGQAKSAGSAARSTGADLVLATSTRMPGALLGARRAGVATLLYAGDPLAPVGPWRVAARAAARLAARLADGVLVPSRAAAVAYERRGVPTTVLPPAIEAPQDAAAVRPRGAAFRRALGIAPDDRLVCSLGALTEGRGQDTLVEAVAEAASHSVAWRLVIAGAAYPRPPDLEFERRLHRLVAERGVGDRVLFAGRVDDPEALYAAADVFVNPARVGEAFGRAACEALAAGCPVVSTRVGGVEEALRDGETALLVEPDSPRALADAIHRLLADAALASRLADAGARDVAARFAPAVHQAQFERALADVLVRAGPVAD